MIIFFGIIRNKGEPYFLFSDIVLLKQKKITTTDTLLSLHKILMVMKILKTHKHD